MMEAIRSSQTLVLTRLTLGQIPEDGVLRCPASSSVTTVTSFGRPDSPGVLLCPASSSVLLL
jgi:hypothetical protein